MRHSKTIILVLLLASAALAFLRLHNSPQGCALSTNVRRLNHLKNRTALPQQTDFDDGVTLAALLKPGDDRGRWSDSRAASIEGYIVAVSEGAMESANCYSFTGRDTHLEVALRLDARPQERVVLEVTPGMREWAKGQGLDWSTPALKRELVGHWCRFEGWLLFDREHEGESENTTPGEARNWRATAWELHPLTSLKPMR